MASERAREREVYRYYQSWRESLHTNTAADIDSVRNVGPDLKPSRDKALVAFAQLGCLRLNAKRGMITLISSSRAYVMAEATRTTSLIYDHRYALYDELWVGEGSIPRSQGIAENALDPPEYIAYDVKGVAHTGPAFVINNIATDDRFSDREYAGKGVSFYAGVPIASRAGHTIGVYTVSDDRGRDGLGAEELRFMQDMATTVSDHLENIRNNFARYRGERMVHGLGSFIEGHSTIEGGPAEDGLDTSLDPLETRLEQGTEQENFRGTYKGLTISNTAPKPPRQGRPNHDGHELKTTSNMANSDGPDSKVSPGREEGSSSGEQPQKTAQASPEQDPPSPLISAPGSVTLSESPLSVELRRIYARAANILRECTAADGVVFYDAGSTTIGRQHDVNADNMNTSEENLSASGDDQSSQRESSGSDKQGKKPSAEQRAKSKTCQMLGFSFKTSTVAQSNNTSIDNLALSETNLRRFIRRYPRGKIFHYTTDGEISSSEGDKSEASISKPKTTSPRMTRRFPRRRGQSKAMAQELMKVVPGARNVIFLPLWDFTKERWSAGTFVWSRRADQLLDAQNDLSYLKAFGNCIMSEVVRLDAIVADKAKTSFIANISHELRSPLHGILGSIEFLQDTIFDAYQSSMITTVETCGKTLLDTVNHVLDYAKINHLSKSPFKKTGSDMDKFAIASDSTTTLDSDFDLAAVVEEVVEAIYAGQTFRAAGAFHDQHDQHEENSKEAQSLSKADDRGEADKTSKYRRSSTKFAGDVRLTLDIERQASWYVHAQPGAIRRVVMNLLGNSLKYTDKGSVQVSLRSTQRSSKTPGRVRFCLSVIDTGKGMSVDFAKNHAFTAFRQEDSFSTGTGLGLSIVGQIVSSLGGKIDLESTKGEGTQVKVWLSLPAAPVRPLPKSFDILAAVRNQTNGLTMCLLDTDYSESEPTSLESEQDVRGRVEDSVRSLSQGWFGMRIIKFSSMNGIQADFFVYSEPPAVEYLLEHHGGHAEGSEVPLIIMTPNAFESASLTSKGIHELTCLGRVIEVISQPCGPQKLARALYRCLRKVGKFAEESGHPGSLLATLDVNDEPFNHKSISQTAHGSQSSDDTDLEDHSSQTSISRPGLLRMASDLLSDTSETTTSGRKKRSAPDSPRAGGTTDSYTDEQELLARSNNKGPILLVDDNEVNLKLLVAFIRKAKITYEPVTDGLQAVQAYKRAITDPARAFKYILMDISMPVMDGVTATHEIREFERRNKIEPPVTIIALTGQASGAMQQDAYKSGMDHFLPKPVRFKELLRLLAT